MQFLHLCTRYTCSIPFLVFAANTDLHRVNLDVSNQNVLPHDEPPHDEPSRSIQGLSLPPQVHRPQQAMPSLLSNY